MDLTSDEISTVVYSLIRTTAAESNELVAFAKLSAAGNEDAALLAKDSENRIAACHALLAKLSGH